MGTPAFAIPSLEALLGAGYAVPGVYCQPDRPAGRGRRLAAPPVKQWAQGRGLRVLQPASLRDEAARSELAAQRPDAIVVAAYGKLLPASVLNIPRRGALNLHPSLLPKYRGASPVQAAILAGDEVTGVSVILLDEGLDSGPVLAQREEAVFSEDTAGSLGERLAMAGAALMAETLGKWLNGELTPAPQGESEATMTPRLSKADGQMVWATSTAKHLARKVRGLSPWPGCYTTWEQRKLKILEADDIEDDEGDPGTVVVAKLAHSSGSALGVATAAGTLILRRLQLEGRRPLEPEAFLAGHPGFVGARLPS